MEDYEDENKYLTLTPVEIYIIYIFQTNIRKYGIKLISLLVLKIIVHHNYNNNSDYIRMKVYSDDLPFKNTC